MLFRQRNKVVTGYSLKQRKCVMEPSTVAGERTDRDADYYRDHNDNREHSYPATRSALTCIAGSIGVSVCAEWNPVWLPLREV